MSDPYPSPEQATWRTGPVRTSPSDTSPLPLLNFGSPPEPAREDKRTRYLVQGLALVGVALVSGVIWSAFQPRTVFGVAEPAGPAAGKYTFTRAAGPATESDCSAHAYGQTQQFFRQHPCQQLIRALYSTTFPDGMQAVVSVAVVRMPTAEDAAALQALTKQDNTGNVSDMITDGTQLPNGPSSSDMKNGGFAAGLSGNTTTIALAAFVGGHKDNALAKEVSNDALRMQAR